MQLQSLIGRAAMRYQPLLNTGSLYIAIPGISLAYRPWHRSHYNNREIVTIKIVFGLFLQSRILKI